MLKNIKWIVKNCFVGKHFGLASTLGSEHLYFVPFGLTPLPSKGNSHKTWIVRNFFCP
jgi:hypothetical protein